MVEQLTLPRRGENSYTESKITFKNCTIQYVYSEN